MDEIEEYRAIVGELEKLQVFIKTLNISKGIISTIEKQLEYEFMCHKTRLFQALGEKCYREGKYE